MKNTPCFVHCKLIGHTLQNCSKLNDTYIPKASSQKKDTEVQFTKPETRKKTMNVSEKKAGKSVKFSVDTINKTPGTSIELEDGEISLVSKVKNVVNPIKHKNGSSLNLELSLHNSFDLLDVGENAYAGEPKEADGKSPFIAHNDFSSENEGEIFIEKVSLVQNTNLEIPSNVMIGTSQPVICASNKLSEDVENGKSQSLEQCSNVGKRLFPSSSHAPAPLALDSENLGFSLMQSITSPITTTDKILGPDKGILQKSDGTEQLTAASLKSTKILSKLWGDAPDSDLGSETDNEFHNEADASKYLLTPSNTSKKGERGRPKKQRSPNRKNGSQSTANSSQDYYTDTVKTRSKACSQSINTPQQ